LPSGWSNPAQHNPISISITDGKAGAYYDGIRARRRCDVRFGRFSTRTRASAMRFQRRRAWGCKHGSCFPLCHQPTDDTCIVMQPNGYPGPIGPRVQPSLKGLRGQSSQTLNKPDHRHRPTADQPTGHFHLLGATMLWSKRSCHCGILSTQLSDSFKRDSSLHPVNRA